MEWVTSNTNDANGVAPELRFNYELPEMSERAEIESPSFDCSGKTGVKLSFKYGSIIDSFECSGEVLASYDDGISWDLENPIVVYFNFIAGTKEIYDVLVPGFDDVSTCKFMISLQNPGFNKENVDVVFDDFKVYFS